MTSGSHGRRLRQHRGDLLEIPWRAHGAPRPVQRVVARAERPEGGQTGVADKPSEQGEGAEAAAVPKEQHNGHTEEGFQLQWGTLTESIDNMPERYKTVLMTSLAFVICNMDKVRARALQRTFRVALGP